ncbi:hypothetical protein BJ508DRAFT_313944 [Ascobolus immersus RN42]|uniref:Ty3 transposon capsid-like protein domain-containing protein n=1 Tax=Ascobolus immersus RN42 TaxID=1160509 RepID=A0A3N4HL42_ASCIM|nr:hypothetical protein BJ508DRAFT_313944 [Ascobolus immersus RN42]
MSGAQPSPPILILGSTGAYRFVVANPLKTFEGRTDASVETTFQFIKMAEHYAQLIRHFNDIQKIDYNISHLTMKPHRWAIEEWYPTATVTRSNFIEAFKRRWTLENAHPHLSNTLEALEVKATEIDKVNDTYRVILNMMGITALATITEPHLYYQTYYRKIRDPAIINIRRSEPGAIDAHYVTLDHHQDY